MTIILMEAKFNFTEEFGFWQYLFYIIVMTWTGYGIFDKVKRQMNGGTK